MRLEDKVAELTKSIERINLHEVDVAVESQRGVRQLKKELLTERDVLRGCLVDDGIVQVWRTTFDRLQTRLPPTQSQAGGDGALTLPPIVGSSQARARVETERFIWRECFDGYEQSTLLSTDTDVSGLIGPQGFGKTAFLRFLHAKYAFSEEYFVIALPSIMIDDELINAREQIQAGFYRACALRQLEYKEFGVIQSLSGLIQPIRKYAEDKHLTLLLIIDQLRASDNFSSLLTGISTGLINSTRQHKVIVSSSTSRTPRDVFGPFANHVRFQNFTTPSEAQALAVANVAAKDLTGISFLEAVRMTRPGTHKTIAQEGMRYWSTYLDSASDSCKAEHMIVLHGVLSKEYFHNDIEFSDAVDGDTFFWHVVEECRLLREKRPGLARWLLNKLKKEEHTYVGYLHSMVDSPFFLVLPRRTKGNILEDCFAAILCDRRQSVTFKFTKLDGTTTNPNTLHIADDLVVINFTTPSLADVTFSKKRVIVALPDDPDYTGIDFVVIHVSDKKKAKLWFIQSTVQNPRTHGCKETDNFNDWITEVKKYIECSRKRLVFLTPNATPHRELSSVPSALNASDVLHCDFTTQDVTGNHVLLKALKKSGIFG